MEAKGTKVQSISLETFTLDLFLRVLRRRWPILLKAVAGCLVAATFYVWLAPETYRATARVLISPPTVNVLDRDPILNATPINVISVETRGEIIRSGVIARRVVEKLRLHEDEEFVGPTLRTKVALLFRSITGSSPPQRTPDQMVGLATGRVRNGIGVKRVPPTLVLEVSFDSAQPGKAARIANELADAYVADQLELNSEAAAKASAWLKNRLDELRDQSAAADRAVQDYRSANDMVDTAGRLITEQRLSELNTQLAAAQTRTAEAKARLDRISEISHGHIPEAAVADVLRNTVITQLRSKYLEAAQREAEFRKRYGESHGATENLRSEMREAQRAINDEVDRIRQTFQSDYQISLAREEAARLSVTDLSNQIIASRRAQVKARELESVAQSYRTLHDQFLQRYIQAVQQQSGATSLTEARVITAAGLPGSPASPNPGLIFPASVFAGGLLGFAVALGREMLDRAIKTPGDLERASNTTCLATLRRYESPAEMPYLASIPLKVSERSSKPLQRAAGGALIDSDRTAARHVTIAMAQIQRALHADGQSGTGRVVSFISCLQGEGKTTVSLTFASAASAAGISTLLIDCDFRRPELSRLLSSSGAPVLQDICDGTFPIDGAVMTVGSSNLSFLPARRLQEGESAESLLTSVEFEQLLSSARQNYRLVLLDLPPIGPVGDGLLIAEKTDAFFLVAGANEITADLMNESLRRAPSVLHKLRGSVLNKADPGILRRYGTEADLMIAGIGQYEYTY